MANCHFTVLRIAFIVLWEVPGAFQSSDGMGINQHRPWGDVNAVSTRLDASVSICQYSPFASRVNKIVASPRILMHASIGGIK